MAVATALLASACTDETEPAAGNDPAPSEAALIAEEADQAVQDGRVEAPSGDEFRAAAERVEEGLSENPSAAERDEFRAASEQFIYGIRNSQVDVDTGDPQYD